jgi:hypothetical protein
MQRVLAIAVLLIGSSFLMAANPPASSPDKPPANPASAEPQGPPPPPPMTGTLEGATPGSDGLLFQSLGWDKSLREKSRVSFYGYIQNGISTNNTIKKGDPGELYPDDPGNAGPGAIGNGATGIIGLSDTDKVTMEQLELWIERGIRGNMVPGVTPTPGPMYKHFDWGFSSETDYGRAQNPCRMTGFDHDWAMNPSAQQDTFDRYDWFCQPTAQLDLYFPVLKGIALRIGRQPDQVMTDEVPPNAFFSPNLFYSHAYSMTRAHQQLGARIFATVMHSHQYGYAMAEFMVDPNAQQATHSLNGSPNYGFALRYRTPKMDTWVDYSGRFGPGEIKMNCNAAVTSCTSPVKEVWINDQLANDHLFSTTHQMFFENALQITHEFSPKWKADILFQFGKQFGDGAATTAATYTPAGLGGSGPGILNLGFCEHVFYEYSATVIRPACRNQFTGASFDDITAHVTYSFNKKLNASFRVEQFHDPNAYFGEPPFSALSYPQYTGLSGTTCGSEGGYCYDGPPIWGAVEGAHNDVTGGINYNPNIHFRIRPEIRYDWQSGSYGIPMFGQNNLLIESGPGYTTNTSSSQVTAAIDTILYF